MAVGDKIYIADKPTQDTINTKVGANTNSAGTTTIFARLRQIYDYLVDTVYNYLTTNLSTTRTAKIDNLDTTVSSRAPASTALSTSTWSSTRAAKLDNLDETISSRATASSVWTNATRTLTALPSVVKSVQRGVATLAAAAGDEISVDVAISAVNTNKTLVHSNISFVVYMTNTSIRDGYVDVYLKNSTTVTIVGRCYSSSINIPVRWEVIEYN